MKPFRTVMIKTIIANQICTKMPHGFKFDFSKNFLGRGSPSPLTPGTLPPLEPIGLRQITVSGFNTTQFSSAFAPSTTGFALDTRALRAPLIRASPFNFRLATLVWPPHEINLLDPPLQQHIPHTTMTVYVSSYKVAPSLRPGDSFHLVHS